MAGRPGVQNRRITPKDLDHFIRKLATGCTIQAAANSAGISTDAVRDHRQKNPTFQKRFDKATARARTTVENSLFKSATEIDNHGRRDTKAGLAWLYNRAPEDWKERRQDFVDHFFHDQAETRRIRADLSPEAREELQELGKRELLREDPEPSVH